MPDGCGSTTAMGLGENLDLDDLCDDADAVLLATGLWQERRLTGDDQVEGVIDALALPRGRQARRNHRGARPRRHPRRRRLRDGRRPHRGSRWAREDIFIVFDGPRSDMHWHMTEDWFAQPGHHALMHCRPLGFHADYHGQLLGLRVRHTELGRDGELSAGLVIEAMGLEIDRLAARRPGRHRPQRLRAGRRERWLPHQPPRRPRRRRHGQRRRLGRPLRRRRHGGGGCDRC